MIVSKLLHASLWADISSRWMREARSCDRCLTFSSVICYGVSPAKLLCVDHQLCGDTELMRVKNLYLACSVIADNVAAMMTVRERRNRPVLHHRRLLSSSPVFHSSSTL